MPCASSAVSCGCGSALPRRERVAAMREDAAAALRALYETVERLRAPGGCPWDREQTHRSLRPYLLEETYETLEAIEGGREAILREELGDLLLQVFMHCAIAQEAEDGFDIGDVAEVTRTKMIHRHPHVFGDTQVSGAAEVVVNWERLKAAEKGERLSVLDGVPTSLPALAYALGVQKRPARIGFDETPALDDAIAALRRALDDVVAASASATPSPQGADWTTDTQAAVTAPELSNHAAGPPPAAVGLEDSVGDLLFAVVALSRRLRVNPEDALRRRAHAFADEFRHVERQVRADGVDLHDVDTAEWTRRWRSPADR
jgi:MazG family protein